MNDRDFDNYLALLTGLLRLRSRQQAAISEELRDHLVEHVAHLEARGVTHDEAVRAALAEFGDAAALAANFSHLVRARRRRLIMRCTIGTACVLVGLAMGIVALRPQETDRTVRLVAQEPPKAELALEGVAANQPSEEKPASSNEQTRQRLATKIDADFVDTPLADVLNYIADVTRTQFYLDPSSEQAANGTQPINMRLKDVPAEMILDLTCRRTGIGYRLRSGVIMVSTQENLPYEPEVRVYNVPEHAVEELARLIPMMIDVHSWRPIVITQSGFAPAGLMGGYAAPYVTPDNSGGGGAAVHNEGTIQVFRGALVISQTPETHQKIEKLLDDLQPVLDKKPAFDKKPAPLGIPGLAPPSNGPHTFGVPSAVPGTAPPALNPGNSPTATPALPPVDVPKPGRPRKESRPGSLPSATPSVRGANLNPPTGGSNPISVAPAGASATPALNGATDAPTEQPLPGVEASIGLPSTQAPKLEPSVGSPTPPPLRKE